MENKIGQWWINSSLPNHGTAGVEGDALHKPFGNARKQGGASAPATYLLSVYQPDKHGLLSIHTIFKQYARVKVMKKMGKYN